ncbi:HMG-box domain-containing protein [Streptomyces sp. SID3212]|uniref:HMG-box domain-containing protein n=1 Tax=unclassified Streptomyces TaxID=2593676 RepID=UPI00136B1BC5|nr:HMG-box domain-containing protein [Streptomyces sp. SID3212]MYV55437.1 hypothetical protein [Streptomyces sp. SID3212]
MAPQQTRARAKAGTSGGSKKLTPFNKFVKTELARLAVEHPEMTHQERFKLATANWKTKN